MSTHQIEVGDVTYELIPQPVRTSLSDGPPMLWGFEVHVTRDGRSVGVKTCFVGRVSVQTRAPEAVDGPMEKLAPVLHALVFEKIEARLRDGDDGNEIVFA